MIGIVRLVKEHNSSILKEARQLWPRLALALATNTDRNLARFDTISVVKSEGEKELLKVF